MQNEVEIIYSLEKQIGYRNGKRVQNQSVIKHYEDVPEAHIQKLLETPKIKVNNCVMTTGDNFELGTVVVDGAHIDCFKAFQMN